MPIEDYNLFGFTLPRGFIDQDTSRLLVSTCLAVNAKSKLLTEETGFPAFYKEFLKIRAGFDPRRIQVFVGNGNTEVRFRTPTHMPFMFGESPAEPPDPESQFALLREHFWNEIFPAVSGTSDLVYRPTQLKVEAALGKERLPHIRRVLSEKRQANLRGGGEKTETRVTETLDGLRQYASYQNERGRRERLQFTRSSGLRKIKADQSNGIVTTSAELHVQAVNRIEQVGLQGFNEENFRSYAASDIDVDDFMHRFNAIVGESHLARIMGFIYDFEIDLKKVDFQCIPSTNERTYFTLRFESTLSTTLLVNPVQVNGVNIGGKTAYLVGLPPDPEKEQLNQEQFFIDSVLDATESEVISWDPVALEIEASTAEASGTVEDIARGEGSDCLTRGLLYTHPRLEEMSSSIEFPGEGVPLTSVYVTQGHCVGVVVGDFSAENLFSLTACSFELRDKADNILISRGVAEGAIHFDAPMIIADPSSQEPKGITSNIMFDYSGELLSHKSSFSRVHRIKRIEHELDLAESQHDDGMWKAKERFRPVLRFSSFPFNEKVGPVELQAYACRYGIPTDYQSGSAPRLRYRMEYRFVMNQKYLNDWFLPLKPSSDMDIRLTVFDLIKASDDRFLSRPVTYKPLENISPPTLFHTRKNAVKEGASVAEREQLDTIAILTKSGSGGIGPKRARHLLPARITFEQAFFHDLFHNLVPRETYDLKRRHNCPFTNKAAHDDFKRLTNQSCYECNEAYCGGTEMAKYYEQSVIRPRYLSNPGVEGFDLRLFWKKETQANEYLIGSASMKFAGEPGLSPQSCRLVLQGGKRTAEIKPSRQNLEISLKPGMVSYARISSKIRDEYRSCFDTYWWMQGFIGASPVPKGLKDGVPDQKAVDKIVTLVHAVKEPLITPRILSFVSHNLPIAWNNLIGWIRLKYKGSGGVLNPVYRPDRNLIAITPELPTIEVIRAVMSDTPVADKASKTARSRIAVTSSFERLDAIEVSNGRLSRSSSDLPTGKLELMTRAEEYADDPRQYAFVPGSIQADVNHIPNTAVMPFSDLERNRFSIDKDIEFTDEMVGQFASFERTSAPTVVRNPFTEISTKLDVDIDLKTFRFEEREYYVRNTSKFKGFFTEDTSPDARGSEQYVLPKQKQVREQKDLRFKVMVLNSKPPVKAGFSHALTTIRETRQKKGDRTFSTQSGDTLTVYLDRGRCESGKDLRVGVTVWYPTSTYHKIFVARNLISRVGRDIVSDTVSPRTSYIRFDPADPGNSEIVIPSNNPYDATFDQDLGIVSYLPRFDFEKQLWKFEVELNVKGRTPRGLCDLHNPFVNLILVNHQPFSLDYNVLARQTIPIASRWAPAEFAEFKAHPNEDPQTSKNRVLARLANYSLIENDCRISEPTSALWGHLTPRRTINVVFDTPGLFDDWGDANLTLHLDRESLHRFKANDPTRSKTDFLVSVEGSNDGEIWYPIKSGSTARGGTCDDKWFVSHPLIHSGDARIGDGRTAKGGNLVLATRLRFSKKLDPCNDDSKEFNKFRLRVVEVEWFDDKSWSDLLDVDPGPLASDVLDQEKLRVRYVELIT